MTAQDTRDFIEFAIDRIFHRIANLFSCVDEFLDSGLTMTFIHDKEAKSFVVRVFADGKRLITWEMPVREFEVSYLTITEKVELLVSRFPGDFLDEEIKKAGLMQVA